jgi:hypothetical protein
MVLRDPQLDVLLDLDGQARVVRAALREKRVIP